MGEIEALAQANPRYGYRRAWALRRRKRTLNRKRVHRLWKWAKLQGKRVNRLRARRERPPPKAAAYPNHVWAYDFLQNQDMHGRTFYILPMMDEFTFFASLPEARVRLEAFRHHFNHDRPHSRLDYRTPAAYRKALDAAQAQQQGSLIPT